MLENPVFDPPQTYHSLSMTAGKICAQGFDFLSDDCFAIIAKGNHFNTFGIADNSILLCDTKQPVHPGDLVVTLNHDNPEVKLYRPLKPIPEGLDIPVLQTKKGVCAKIIGSFNFYA